MTVSTQVSRNEYTGNGATTQYDFTFRILDKSHLLVQLLDASENIMTLTLGTDYTVTGVNRYNGGKVVLTSALPAGYKISIERSTPVTQEASIRNQGGFFPEIHEDAFDKLTMLVQQAYGWWSGLSLRKPSWLANYYDALNNRIRNLRDPSQAQDASTKNYVDESVAGSISHADDLFKRTIRVPENSVNEVYPISGRRDSLFGWNSSGNPVPIFSMTDTADLALKLASNDEGLGANLVGLHSFGTVQNAITYLTPEMFGAKGDGVTDDYYAIQQMLDEGPPGCTFIFDGAKNYYNAFGNKTPADAWLDLEDRNEWRRTAAATFKFNGAGLRRRYPFWNDNNAKNNMNSGAYYTDDHTALLRLTGAGPFIIEDANFDSGIQTGALVNGNGIPTGQTNYAVGQCMDFGLIIENCTDVTVKSGTFKNSVFPIYVDGCTDISISANVKYAAQAAKRVTTTDLAYGGGCKVLNSTNVKLFLVGLRNVNTTAEIESLNSNVHVEGWSNLDYSNSLVVFGSQHVHLKWTARNVQNGVGVYIRGGFSAMETNFITGDVIIDSASYFGCYVYLAASATTSMYGINLNVQTRNCGSHGLYINAESGSGRVIDGVNCSHQSSGDDGGSTGTGAPTRVNGLVKGEIKIDPANAYQGFWASGNNSADTSCVVRFSGNTRGATNKWTITSTMRIDVDIITNTNHYRLTCAQFIDTGAITAGGGFDNSNSYVRTYGRFSQDQATYPLFPKMKGAVSGANYELVYDPADFVVVEGAKKYNVQLVILN